MSKYAQRLATSLARKGGMWLLVVLVGLASGCVTSGQRKFQQQVLQGQSEIKHDLAETHKVAKRAERKSDKNWQAIQQLRRQRGQQPCGRRSARTFEEWVRGCTSQGGVVRWNRTRDEHNCIGSDARSSLSVSVGCRIHVRRHVERAQQCPCRSVSHGCSCSHSHSHSHTPAKVKTKKTRRRRRGRRRRGFEIRRVFPTECSYSAISRFVKSYGGTVYMVGEFRGCTKGSGMKTCGCIATVRLSFERSLDYSDFKRAVYYSCGACCK